MELITNCKDIKIGETLGVAHYNFNLFEKLSEEFNLKIICETNPEYIPEYKKYGTIFHKLFPSSLKPAKRYNIFRRLKNKSIRIAREKCYSPQMGRKKIEYLPHHFQNHITSLPRVITCHDLHVFDIPWKYGDSAHGMQQRLIKNMLNATAIVTEFPRTFQRLPDYCGDKIKEKLFLSYTPLLIDNRLDWSASQIEKIRRKYSIEKNEFVLLYPAQLQLHKNHANLLQALKRVLGSGKKIKLICPGSDYSREISENIQKLCSTLGLDKHVSFPGWVSNEELKALYKICSGVISPSLAEGGAYIALEAIAFRKPVACSNIESALLHLKSMKARVPLFDPESVEQIAEAIEILCDRSELIVAENREAEIQTQSWTWERAARRYLDIFNWVAAGYDPESRPALSEGELLD